jgi:prepilin-type processing-associated H-X9-DG protein
MIMIGMYNHHDVNKKFPAAFISKDGKPLLSWRVALLPYLEGEEGKKLYEQFHLDETWDSAHNKALIEKIPAVFQSPASELNDGPTVYLTPRADFTAFPDDRGISIRKILDGTSKTIGLLEVDDAQAVPWTKPDDWKIDLNQPKVGFRGQYDNGMNTAFVDGSVHFIAHAVDEKLLKALLTIQGREVIRLPD